MSGPMQLMGGVFVPVATPSNTPTEDTTDAEFLQAAFASPSLQIASYQARPPSQAMLPRPAKTAPLTPKNVLKLAKARLREVNKELRRMEALMKERGELERLVVAAEAKPAKAPSPTIVNIKR